MNGLEGLVKRKGEIEALPLDQRNKYKRLYTIICNQINSTNKSSSWNEEYAINLLSNTNRLIAHMGWDGCSNFFKTNKVANLFEEMGCKIDEAFKLQDLNKLNNVIGSYKSTCIGINKEFRRWRRKQKMIENSSV